MRLYRLEYLGSNRYLVGIIDRNGAHEETWLGDPLARLIALGLVRPSLVGLR